MGGTDEELADPVVLDTSVEGFTVNPLSVTAGAGGQSGSSPSHPGSGGCGVHVSSGAGIKLCTYLRLLVEAGLLGPCLLLGDVGQLRGALSCEAVAGVGEGA